MGAIIHTAWGIKVYPGDKGAEPGRTGIIIGFQGRGS